VAGAARLKQNLANDDPQGCGALRQESRSPWETGCATCLLPTNRPIPGSVLTPIYNVYTFEVMDVRYVLHGQACEVFFDPFVRLADAGGHDEARSRPSDSPKTGI
jgi:hypothetical protein